MALAAQADRPSELAGQLHAHGVALNAAGHPHMALKAFRRALRALPVADPAEPADLPPRIAALTGRIWLSIADSESELHGTAAGLSALATAEVVVDAAGDDELKVLLHAQRGFVLIRTGSFDAALDELDAAIAHREFASRHDQCKMLVNRGALALFRGDLRGAEERLRQADTIAAGEGLLLERYKSLHNLAYLRFLRGDLPGALLEMDQALALGADLPRGIPLLDRARVLVEAGLTREADETLAAAVTLFRSSRLGQDVAETLLERARCALIGGDIVDARRLAAAARDTFRRRGNDSWRRTAELLLLQADLAASRPGRRLAPVGLRLQGEFDSAGLPQQARTAALIAAAAYLSAGEPCAAAGVLAAVPKSRRKDPITARMHDCLVRARMHHASGETRAATASVRSGLRQLGAYQASFGSIDLQTAAAVHGRQLGELGVSLALSGGRPAAVLAAAEHARAVSSRLPAVRPPADPESAELLTELRQSVESLHAVAQDRSAAEPLLARRRELERQITARRWSLAGTGDVQPVAGIDAVSAQLDLDDTNMVVLIEAQGYLHAVVADAGRLRIQPLGPAASTHERVRRARADLDVLALPGLPAAMRSVVRHSYDSSIAELDAALIAPLGLSGRRLVIVSAGLFGHLPWGALPSLRGVPVVVAPSATAWLAASEPCTAAVDGVIALAGPDLGRADHEVRGIAAAWSGASVQTGADADREALATAMAKGRIVHVAAHGVHQTENPLFSSLQLADGPLFAHELDQTARTPEHVVLSACELGLATVRPGDEALGLTSVLLHLGTRSVVAGVARVNDEVAAETMIAYHLRLAAGADSATALAGALDQLDPADCAPFVCFGSSWSDTGGVARDR